ncbi:hypothetical protein FWF74_03300 [Candidatus Saccharibacteria bacterium]|nr:hypothetical protein [Candidatus Saccharibacteria bacterium]MCL1962797.1 hypothetical protein [Candidatus Saccharibacteria bacterium]
MLKQRTEFISTRGRARAMAGGGSWNRNQNLTVYASSIKLGPISHAVLIILLIAFLGLLYLTQLTKTSTFGYEMNSINQVRAQLAAEQDDLKIENARLESLSRVQSSSVAAAMTAPVDVVHAD